MTESVEPQTIETDTPVVEQPAPEAEESAQTGKGSLEDLLSDLPEEARKAYMSELSRARNDAAKYRKELREYEPFKAEVEKLKESQKSDLQRLEERATKAEGDASGHVLENAKLRAAIDHGLSLEDLEWLSGKTAEEISERAGKLAERLGSAGAARKRPVEKLRGGASRPEDEPLETDPLKIAERARQLAQG